MAIFLIKDFTKMPKAELETWHVHCGRLEVTTRTFEDIVGRQYRTIKEKALLQEVMDDLDFTLEFPSRELLHVEYGERLCIINDLPKNVLHYLRNTPHNIMWTEYLKAIQTIREVFINRSSEES